MKHTLIAIVSAMVLLFNGCESRSVSDATLTTTVKTKLATDPGTSAIRINVDTSSGVVTLSGVVPTASEKAEAERIARNTEGVRQVVNNITVEREATAGGSEMLSDATTLTIIKSQLVANGILGTNVDVKNGVVTITGEVENSKQKAKAEQIAREATGVKIVNNQLVIKRK
jgi:hyperosmotically inducible protein